MKNRNMNRRDVLRAVPAVMVGAALAGLGRAIVACTDSSADLENRKPIPGTPTKPTDGDEYVPPGNLPLGCKKVGEQNLGISQDNFGVRCCWSP